jgi:hypothetical protein
MIERRLLTVQYDSWVTLKHFLQLLEGGSVVDRIPII